MFPFKPVSLIWIVIYSKLFGFKQHYMHFEWKAYDIRAKIHLR